MLTILIFVVAIAASCRPANTSSQVHLSSQPETELGQQTREFDLNKDPLHLPLVEPRIVVKKAARRLMLYSNGEGVRNYRIALGLDPTGDKVKKETGARLRALFMSSPKTTRVLITFHSALAILVSRLPNVGFAMDSSIGNSTIRY